MQTNRKKLAIAASVLGAFIATSLLVMSSKPEAKRHTERAKPVLKVESQTLHPQDFQFTINSFGTVQPHTQSILVSQVSGQILKVANSFRDGGFFKKGDVLIEIDPRDYQTAAKIIRAELLQSQLSFEEEKARAQQALIDWQRLGDGGEAPALVLRKPQLAASEAGVLSAQANFEKAELDLQRTKIRAPFDGRLKKTQVDLGQYVSANTQLADIFATDRLEVRLPLKNSELALINLPEDYQHAHGQNDKHQAQALPNVTLISSLGTPTRWQGKIVRTEATIDASSNQLYVVAQINQPFARTLDANGQVKTPLKIGQYVSAEIQGKSVKNALIVPTSSVYQGSYVYLIEDGHLARREVEIGYQNAEQVFISKGLGNQVELITSPLGQVTSGTLVNNGSKALVDNRSGSELVASSEGQDHPQRAEQKQKKSELANTPTPAKTGDVQ